MYSRLHELADIHYGKSPSEVLTDESAISVIGTGGAYGLASRAMYQGPAIVVPRKGSLGNPQYVGKPFWPADTTYAVIPKANIDAKWLYYSLASFDLTKLNEATGVPSINRDWLSRISLNSTGIKSQHRIAEILSTLDEAIEANEALIAKHLKIKAGLMHDLFTRGVTPDGLLRPTREQAPGLYTESQLGWIPKAWLLRSLGKLAIRVGSGITPTGGSEIYLSEGITFIRSQNVTYEGLDLSDVAYIDERTHFKMAASEIFAFDVLLNITGASIGRCCFLPEHRRRATRGRIP